MITFGSVCSGIEAASVAWHPLGWRADWLAEIEAFPSCVLEHHYPTVPNLGDMTKIAALIRSGSVAAPDVLVGGTPCQAFSVAGLRNSLDDARGQLSLSFVDIANAIDTTRSISGKPAAVIVWENVPGVLNTKDNAFGCFLAGLAGEDTPLEPAGGKWTNAGCVFGPQRTVAWRVLDAQYFGVAQRRRRVFVVASAREWFDPTKILFEFDGLRRDIAPSRKTGQEVAGTITTSTGKCDQAGSVSGSLVVNYEMSALGRKIVDVSPTIDCRAQNGPMQAQTALGIVTFDRQSSGEYGTAPIASTMSARDFKGATDLIAYGIPGNWIGRAPENGGNAVEPMHNVAPCLTGADRHGVACATFNIYGGNKRIDRPFGGFYVKVNEETTKTLDAATGLNPTCGQGGTAILHQMAVRRLTPTECERLQGFPDGYTLVPVKGKPAAAGPRYKALGNSMAVPCMSFIGSRIDYFLRLAEEK